MFKNKKNTFERLDHMGITEKYFFMGSNHLEMDIPWNNEGYEA